MNILTEWVYKKWISYRSSWSIPPLRQVHQLFFEISPWPFSQHIPPNYWLDQLTVATARQPSRSSQCWCHKLIVRSWSKVLMPHTGWLAKTRQGWGQLQDTGGIQVSSMFLSISLQQEHPFSGMARQRRQKQAILCLERALSYLPTFLWPQQIMGPRKELHQPGYYRSIPALYCACSLPASPWVTSFRSQSATMFIGLLTARCPIIESTREHSWLKFYLSYNLNHCCASLPLWTAWRHWEYVSNPPS